MHPKFLILIFHFAHINLHAQQPLIKDIDFDTFNDTVYIDSDSLYIVCKLSTQEFVPIFSVVNGVEDGEFGVSSTRNGFEYYSRAMRGGFACQFRYDVKSKMVQLIGMSRYEFGNATNDGSGKSSVNLLTGDYIGDWNYYDLTANKGQGKLVKIPTIRAKMQFEPTYLENFDVGIFYDYMERCSGLCAEQKGVISGIE